MTERGPRRFVADLLRGRRAHRFRVQGGEVDELRAAITLRAARPGGGAPREEFVIHLHRSLAAELARDDRRGNAGTSTAAPTEVDLGRRRLVRGASIAAGAAAIGATTDGLLARQAAPGSGDDAEETLTPNAGHWRTVMASADLPEDGVRGFNLDTVTGFVVRGGGQLGAVSGVCTHLGCRLRLAVAARRLNCPCHNASFDLGGQVLHHQLPEAPGPLPHLRVREVDGKVQVFAPRTLGT